MWLIYRVNLSLFFSAVDKYLLSWFLYLHSIGFYISTVFKKGRGALMSSYPRNCLLQTGNRVCFSSRHILPSVTTNQNVCAQDK